MHLRGRVMKVDVAVLGSGFGGCLCALIADRIGLDAVLIDRATHPRFAIGESSTPIADLILRDLAARYDLSRLEPLSSWGSWRRTYPDVLGGIKRGFSYYRHEPGEAFDPGPGHANELLVAASASDERSDTQWYRADVDAFFANEVRAAGIPFFEGLEVEPERAAGSWRLGDFEAGFVIDATGASGALPRLGEPACRTRSRAVYSHFEGVPRWREAVAALGAQIEDYPFDPDGSALHHVVDGGWLWMLRFRNGVVSAGWVLDESRYPLDPASEPADEWRRHLARYPSLEELFDGARLADVPGRIIGTGRLQRRAARAAGEDWALLPHTAGFVDPLHSTGIAHTMSGVERLMEILGRGWGRPELADELDAYQRAILREIEFVDRLVHPCYLSTDSFVRWTASTMLYFAAATSYEHFRARGDRRGFLLADDHGLVAIADEAAHRVRSDESYEAWLEAALEPYNQVGLFGPHIENMYEYTAAPK